MPTTLQERVEILETDMTKLKVWAGEGQITAILDGQINIREELAKTNTKLDRHERLIKGLKTDVSSLKADMKEVLRRLPEPPAK